MGTRITTTHGVHSIYGKRERERQRDKVRERKGERGEMGGGRIYGGKVGEADEVYTNTAPTHTCPTPPYTI